MGNGQGREDEHWYVMRAYKNEKKAEELLSGGHGLRHFIPKRKVMRTCNGKKVVCSVPVIHSLVFVYATHRQIVEFKRDFYNDLQFVTWKCDGGFRCLTVPDGQMDSFIEVCGQKEKEILFCRPDEIKIESGRKVRVHGGLFDKVEGYFVKVAKKRNRRLVVIIPEVLAASVEVEPEYLEFIE